VECLDHFVLLLDVVLDFVEVFWRFAVVFLKQEIDGVFALLGDGEDVFDGVGHNEVFV